MDLTLDYLRAIVDTKQFEKLIGTVENECFDCKSQPYRLAQSETAKRELAKDVSAFANAQGGYIFIGLRTERSATHFGDEVKDVRPFERRLLDPDRYYKVIADWVFPALENLRVEWFEVADRGKGVAVISVPPQNAATKPFLITRTLDEKKAVEILFGYAKRRGDATAPRSVVDLQRALA